MTHPASASAAARPALDAPAPPTVLVVDDEKNIRRTLELVLRGEGYATIEAGSGEEALELLLHGRAPIDLAIVDFLLPKMQGLELVERLRREDPTRDLPVIVISGHATVLDAVKAIKLGASDFFEKPLSRERVIVSVGNALEVARARRALLDVAGQLRARYEMIGQAPVMRRVYEAIDRVAPTKTSVLITGESGTGKELVGRAIHRLSPRAAAPYVRVNCAAIPRELIESELFGHERGAFTGASARKRGFFEQAHGGTLLLDEVGDMDLAAQAKLLRALQSGEITRVGSEHVVMVDVRVLAATNKDLRREVAAARFREDLYFRLAVFPLSMPALRQRTEDIPALAESFVAAFCAENGMRVKPIEPSVFAVLATRAFPGNVRELKNVMERAAILGGDVITVADLPEDPHANPYEADGPLAEPEGEFARSRPSSVPPLGAPPSGRLPLRAYRELCERRYIVEVLASLDWNISRAAVVLEIERTNLHKKIRAYAIRRGEQPASADAEAEWLRVRSTRASIPDAD